MPPKKKGTAVKAKPSTAPKTTITSDPIVTNKNGKEIETTAAASRPKRDSVAEQPATPIATKKRGRPATAAIEEEPPKKRGKPASTTKPQSELDITGETPKKRGPDRPAKKITTAKAAPAATSKAAAATGKKRGRPAKATTAVEETIDEEQDDEEEPEEEEEAPPKKRGPGRPAKTKAVVEDPIDEEEAEEDELEEQKPPAKKRGRSAKNPEVAPAVPDAETAPPKKRGRPPKGGETTKITADDGAAAEQLEDELQDQIDEAPKAAVPSKRKAPTKKRKGKAAVLNQEEETDSAGAQDELEDDPQNETSGKTYWLMKAEQEDREEILASGEPFNTKFTIDDLRSKTEPEPWDGVRNPTAAKNMRAMKKGDLAFFYASGGKSGRKPGIVGIMEIVKEHEPDPTTSDPNAYGYVANKNQRDRWCVVHVEFRKKLSKPVFLSELQKYKQQGAVLANMQEFTAARLSVSKVTEKEWDFITTHLVQGFDEDEPEASAAQDAVLEKETTVTTETNGNVIIEENIEFPNGGTATIETVETEVFDTDALISDRTMRASSRQASLAPPAAASRATSRAGSRAGSRADSRAPGARGRTPNPF